MKNISRLRPLAVTVVALLVAACATYEELTPGGEKVRILSANEVQGCRLLGKVTSSVTEKAGIYTRTEGYVKQDVEYNARNSAADMGGDTVVPMTKLTEGRQTFEVYKCINP
jgi:hypothetical protein